MKKVCTNCFYVGNGVKHTPGSFLIELVLWLCFFVPGIIYSIWRLSARTEVCPLCGAADMIPAGSPRGVALIEANVKQI